MSNAREDRIMDFSWNSDSYMAHSDVKSDAEKLLRSAYIFWRAALTLQVSYHTISKKINAQRGASA